MKRIPTGYMRPAKTVLGVLLIVAGGGLLLFESEMTNLLCSNKMIFAAVLLVSGFFLAKEKRHGRY